MVFLRLFLRKKLPFVTGRGACCRCEALAANRKFFLVLFLSRKRTILPARAVGLRPNPPGAVSTAVSVSVRQRATYHAHAPWIPPPFEKGGRKLLIKEVNVMKKAPHVAAVHDLSGLGRCSLSVVLPVLSAMGCWCSPLPTAFLSASTIFPPSGQFVFRDLTGEMSRCAAHWTELGVSFDALYTGFVGSQAQIAVVEQFLLDFRDRHTLTLVDPVMGDWGRPYRTYTPEMCREMCSLSNLADVITPNLTEAAILLGESYENAPATRAGLSRWLERLSGGGRRSVILTGVRLEEGMVGAGSFDRDTGKTAFACAPEEPAEFPGTGDLFASVALGALLQGDGLERAAAKAVAFVSTCAHRTLELGSPIREGVEFEGALRLLLEETP